MQTNLRCFKAVKNKGGKVEIEVSFIQVPLAWLSPKGDKNPAKVTHGVFPLVLFSVYALFSVWLMNSKVSINVSSCSVMQN